MNILIIGGLFVIGVLALIGLFFAVRGERKSAPAQSTASEERRAPEQIPLAASAAQAASVQPDAIVPVPAPQGEQPFPLVNGQFHELSAELHALNTQAQELEQRLGVLTGVVERIEQSQKSSSSGPSTTVAG